MATLHLRDVPDETVAQLRRIAAQHRTSMNAVAVQELVSAARRADNAALLEALPDLNVDPASIVDGIAAERAAR
ncbi:MAG: antitoxin [Actinomycetes bacterium]